MGGPGRRCYLPQYDQKEFYFRAVLAGVSPETRVTYDRSKFAHSTRVEVYGMKPLPISEKRCDRLFSCNVSCSVSSQRHFVYLCDSGSRNIQRIEACFETAGRNLRVDMNPEKGSLVVSRLPDTGKYARCIVLENNAPISVRIFFVDYGPTVSVDPDQVFCLEHFELLTTAPQAFLVDADVEDRRMTDSDFLLFKRHPTVQINIVGVSEDKCAFKVIMKLFCEGYGYRSVSELLKRNVEISECSRVVERRKLRDLPRFPSLVVCYNCDRTGHSPSECPLAMCYKCNQSGHMFRDCPNIASSNAIHLKTDPVHSCAREVSVNRPRLSNSLRITRNEIDGVSHGFSQGFCASAAIAGTSPSNMTQIRHPDFSKNQVCVARKITLFGAAKIRESERPLNTRGTDDNVKSEEDVGFAFNVISEADAVRMCINKIVSKKAVREELQKVDPELLEELERYVKIWKRGK